ncbi:MAG: LytTR family transcriptional regulator DNA-binding domain-containing protein [Novosphingobium sp.]|nr:LytTR family transcriptional regulator DNA-binding domain-containing protein [Novosphingobium sp.]
MNLRRFLLEVWAMAVASVVVGFMGPFGTYDDNGLAGRVSLWWLLLIGAYTLIRPAILALRWLARKVELPEIVVTFWGVAALSGPMAVYWRIRGHESTGELDNYATILPFSLICALGVLGVVQWAERADRRLTARARAGRHAPPEDSGATEIEAVVPEPSPPTLPGPPLMARLSPRFQGPILALQSEDHYVRVHGQKESELLLMRLRDAIAEMEGVEGQQVHRSWWVASAAVERAEPAGRSWQLILRNGLVAPVARDSVSRLRSEGLLPFPQPAC